MKRLTVLLLAALLLVQPSCQPSKKGTFEVGNREFLLNGEPFVVKSGEMHYPRIPQPYWKQRLEMCRALGMNTVCLYVFWNLHEPQPGVYDFEGQNDVAAFCRLAQQLGLYVILRPGPYACAEWDMGGLPWWLLQHEGIQLRSTDDYYMERVRLFMAQLGRQLAPLQISRGGNILMVQVENEFGSYGTDKPYLEAVAQILRESGFTDVPLFQCDWSSNFQKNALDGLVWTINFGAGSDVEKQFKPLMEASATMPLMCSEYWSGWFDRWGSPHETRSTEALVSGMEAMLERNISFSLYMAHGGTTFGHWTGANCPPYASWCSSYDYDAPISEAGHATGKFFAVRELLARYSDHKLPPVPREYPVMTIPEFSLTETAPLFESLPVAVSSEDIRPMEYFGEGYGSILYRTILPEALAEPTVLLLDEVHDWARVFLDGKELGSLDRRRAEREITLPPCAAGCRLDILVENMGRVNYGRTIYDWKGITSSVWLGQGKGRRELKQWQVFPLPAEYEFTAGRPFRPMETVPAQPAFYRGTFRLSKVADTYLDMSRWGKGMVWVNGHAIGRFWQIGPQQTLYMPGCWLRKGENEILVIDWLSPEKPTVSGLDKPVLDCLRQPGEALQTGQTGNWNRVEDDTPTTVVDAGPSVLKPAAKVWQVDLLDEVNAASWLQVRKGFARAEADSADWILLHMNTYGGEVMYADSIRTRILNARRPVCVFIDNNAASAGALISIACDRIVMRPGATIGATTVVNQTGAAAPDKYQSYMRATMRATAEAKGRDPQIAEAMVDPDVAVAGIIDTGKVLTFTAREAMAHGYCDGLAESIPEVLQQQLGLDDYELKQYQATARDRMKGHLMGTTFRALLIMIIIAGIWFELQTPGIGFPSIAALAAAVLYFAPLYLDGLVDYWEIIVFVLGFVLLMLEIFVIPGFGVAGISGILCMAAGLIFAMVGRVSFDLPLSQWQGVDEAFAVVTVSALVAVGLCLWISHRIGRGHGLLHRVALEADQSVDQGYVGVPKSSLEELVGREGQAATILRPGGKVVVDGMWYDAVAQVGYVESGQPVRIVGVEAGQLYVEEIK